MSRLSTSASRHFRPDRFHDPRSATQRAAVAVSACLAGDKVRYDGADKLLPRYPLLSQALRLIPVCPEVGAGLGVPRPPVQLVAIGHQIRARGRDDPRLDVTAALQNFAARSLAQLTDNYPLCGYLWKSRSPSCGFGSTPLFNGHGSEISRANGIQADHFQRHLPHLNYREDTALGTDNAIDDFVLRCRLTFDILYATSAPLTVLHGHYAFLHEHYDQRITERLLALSRTNDKANYLAAFLTGCNQIAEEHLLELFN